jgi:N-formylglutamate amidohydrolase
MLLWRLERGDSPLIVSVPHAGRHVPDAIALRMTPQARALPDTDWHVDELYRFAPMTGATFVVATHSRYVVDLNRDPSGAALYPGADNTELCPTRTFANDPIYVPNEAPTEDEIAARRVTFFDPWRACVSEEIRRIRARHGYAVLLDGHSIAAEVPRFFAGRLPDLNLGTADGRSCAPSLQALAAGVLSDAARFSHVVNGRFKGGYVTRSFGAPHAGVHALQLEMVQDCYMDESRPALYDSTRAAGAVALLERLVIAVSEWRP